MKSLRWSTFIRCSFMTAQLNIAFWHHQLQQSTMTSQWWLRGLKKVWGYYNYGMYGPDWREKMLTVTNYLYNFLSKTTRNYFVQWNPGEEKCHCLVKLSIANNQQWHYNYGDVTIGLAKIAHNEAQIGKHGWAKKLISFYFE